MVDFFELASRQPFSTSANENSDRATTGGENVEPGKKSESQSWTIEAVQETWSGPAERLDERILTAPEEIQPGLKRLLSMATREPERARQYRRLVNDLIELETAGKLTDEMRFYLKKGGTQFLKDGGADQLIDFVDKVKPKPERNKPPALERPPLSMEDLKAGTDAAFGAAMSDIELYEQTSMVRQAKQYTNEILSKYFPGVEATEVFAGNEGLAVRLNDGTILKFRPNTEWDASWGYRDLDMPMLSIDGSEPRPMLVGKEGRQWIVYRQPFGESPDARQVKAFLDQVKRLRGDTGDFGQAVDAASRQLGKYKNPDSGRVEVRCFDYGALEVELSGEHEFGERDVLDLKRQAPPNSKPASEANTRTEATPRTTPPRTTPGGAAAPSELRIETSPFESGGQGDPRLERPAAAMESGKMIEIQLPGGLIARMAKAEAPTFLDRMEKEFKTEQFGRVIDELINDKERSEEERRELRDLRQRYERLPLELKEECKCEFFRSARTQLGLEPEVSESDRARSGRVTRALSLGGGLLGVGILSSALLRHCMQKEKANSYSRVNVQFIKG